MDSQSQMVIILLIMAVVLFYIYQTPDDASNNSGGNNNTSNNSGGNNNTSEEEQSNTVPGFFENSQVHTSVMQSYDKLIRPTINSSNGFETCQKYAEKTKTLGTKAWTYRHNNHPEEYLRNTCVFYTHLGNGTSVGVDDHSTSCVDVDKTPPNC